ncbi:hypothetical protein ES703_10161 [subsurface metagenome]
MGTTLRSLVGRHVLLFFEDLDGTIRDCTGYCVSYMPPDLISLKARKKEFDVLGRYIIHTEVLK